MKISKNWLNNYIESKKTNDDLVDLFTDLGLECTYKEYKINFDHIVIGKIVKCAKHPNADKLKLCEVNVGNEILNIVCGAPNVKTDITVPVAKVGAVIGKYKIKKTKIRGVESNGMICSGKELALSDDHEGILILNDDFIAGKGLKESLEILDDSIFDFDITPNRGDCFSHIGIARELSIIENKIHKKIKPNLSFDNTFKSSDLIKVKISNDNICKRYACRVIKDIKVEESPQWLKNTLNMIGQKSVNNIVDIANYIMFDLGQPLHVFDYDKLSGNKIEVRLAENKEKIKCLNNEVIELSSDDIVICDSKEAIAVAGVIGGFDSQVTNNTTNILLESAVFNEINIRRTSKKHNYDKEASKRFERGIDFENVCYVMDRFAEELQKLSEVKISKDIVDVINSKRKKNIIKFNLNNCNRYLGTELKINDCKNIFRKLSIDLEKDKDCYLCNIPSYRNDVIREVDLYEEIARVYGYNNIPSNKTFKVNSDSFEVDALHIEDVLRNVLSNIGFNEHYSNSLYSEKDVKSFSSNKFIKLMNPLSPELQYLRNSLVPGVLRAISYNLNRNEQYIKLFEIGSVQVCDNSKYNKANERRLLCIAWNGKNKPHWKHPNTIDIYTVKGEIELLFKNIGFEKIDFCTNENKILDIKINNKLIGDLNLIDNKTISSYELNGDVFICNIDIDEISKMYYKSKIEYKKISPFPLIKRDIAILLDVKYKNEDILNSIKDNGGKYLNDIQLFDYYQDDKIGEDKKSLAYSLTFRSKEKTLQDKDININIDQIINSLKSKFKAVQR